MQAKSRSPAAKANYPVRRNSTKEGASSETPFGTDYDWNQTFLYFNECNVNKILFSFIVRLTHLLRGVTGKLYLFGPLVREVLNGQGTNFPADFYLHSAINLPPTSTSARRF